MTFRNRNPGWLDLSVNYARVEEVTSEAPTMVTGTGQAAAGAFNGGGVGNKAILAGPLNSGVLTSLGSDCYRFTHDTATHYVQVVNAFTTVPLVSPPVPVAAGAGPVWNNAAFRWSDILASFPGAQLVDVASGDGGLPKTTVTPSVLLCVGDSSNHAHRAYRVLKFTVNGSPALGVPMNFNLPAPKYLAKDGTTELSVDDPDVYIVERGNLRCYPKDEHRREMLVGKDWVPLEKALAMNQESHRGLAQANQAAQSVLDLKR